MTNFTINGNKQNGLGYSPMISMNVVKAETKYPSTTRAKLRTMQAEDHRKMSNCTRKEYDDFKEATDLIIEAADPELVNIMGRF